jgi:hypothetical protein
MTLAEERAFTIKRERAMTLGGGTCVQKGEMEIVLRVLL